MPGFEVIDEKEKKAYLYYREGLSAQDRGDYSEALECYEESLKLEMNAINFSINIQNRSEAQMPFSFGLHPYFNVTDLCKIEINGLLEIRTLVMRFQAKIILSRTVEAIP